MESEDPEDLRLSGAELGALVAASSASSSSSSSSVLWQLKCLWIIAQALLFAFCVAAFIYATDGATGIAGEGVVAFAAISFVFALFTSVAGSCILWKHQTQFLLDSWSGSGHPLQPAAGCSRCDWSGP